MEQLAMLDPLAKKALVIAHPDDEALWCGGLLARYPANWTVICCSMPYKDAIRAWKFQDACAFMGVKFRIFPMFEGPHTSFDYLSEIDCLSDFDTVVTHNHRGEYGHVHHLAVNKWVRKTFQGAISFIGYGLKQEELVNATTLELTDPEWDLKMEMLRCYNHVIPWCGKRMPCYEALLDDYTRNHPFDLRREQYICAS